LKNLRERTILRGGVKRSDRMRGGGRGGAEGSVRIAKQWLESTMALQDWAVNCVHRKPRKPSKKRGGRKRVL